MLKKTLQIFGAVLLGLAFSLIFFILLLRWINPPFTAFTLQADWSELDQDFYSLRTNWIPADEMPEQMIWSVVASEDQLFFEHNGFDFESMEEAWEERREGEGSRGASTISMQVSKNLFLSPAQSLFRKGIEAGITVLIEFIWPKERIIEMYLNIAEFGPGIFGIGKASQHYFNRRVDQLTPEMAARFAAVLPNPKRMRVNPPSPYTQERSMWILQQMNQLTGKVYYSFGNEDSEDEPEESNSEEPDSADQDIFPDLNLYDFESDSDSSSQNMHDSSATPVDTTDSSRIN